MFENIKKEIKIPSHLGQLPDFEPESEEEKMLLAIKRYCQAGADEIERIEAENAELKARLEKAVELPCKIGDTIYCIFGTTEIQSWEVEKIILCEDWYSITCGHTGTDDYICVLSKEYGIWWFTDRVKAESRLAELKGEIFRRLSRQW